MPRKKIALSGRIDYLSVLTEDGRLDKKLEPEIDTETLLKLYRTMLLSRKFDERLLNMQRQGRIGTFPPAKGQEAAHLGAAAALKPTDWMVPSFREMAAEVWRGRSLESIILFDAGFNEGAYVPPEINNFPICVPVGSQILHAVGVAWAMKYRKTDQVTMAFFGDGATSQGDFHEGLNFAGVYQAPVVFVCQNNQWAISVPRSKQTRSETLAQKALAYGIEGIQVDGNDILAVYAAAQEAVDRARAGQGPTLIECVTYRLIMHTTSDDPKRYRSDKEVQEWETRDPLPRFESYLRKKGILKPAAIKKIETDVTEEIQTAVERAERRIQELGDPLDMFKHVYAELPPALEEQQDAFARWASRPPQEEDHG